MTREEAGWIGKWRERESVTCTVNTGDLGANGRRGGVSSKALDMIIWVRVVMPTTLQLDISINSPRVYAYAGIWRSVSASLYANTANELENS